MSPIHPKTELDNAPNSEITAKKMANIDKSKDVKLVCYPRKRSFITKLLKYITIDESNLHYQIDKIESFIIEFQSKPLALMPFLLEIK